MNFLNLSEATRVFYNFFFFQAEDGIRDGTVTGVQTCALPISARPYRRARPRTLSSAHPRPHPATQNAGRWGGHRLPGPALFTPALTHARPWPGGGSSLAASSGGGPA